jgi:hypothetical protein
MGQYVLASKVNIASAGLYAAPSPTAALPGGGANVRVTSTAHGLTSGNAVTVSGTTGVSGLNADWPVRVIDANTFDLVGSSALTGTQGGTMAVSLVVLDISPADFNKEWYLRGVVYGTGEVAFEDTVDNFTASEKRFRVNARNSAEGQAFCFSWRDWEGSDRFGTASAKLRIRLLSGTNVKVSAVVETLA